MGATSQPVGRSPQSSARCANGGKVTHVQSDLWARCCSPYSAFRSCSPTRERAHHLEVYATCWQAVRTRFIRRRPALETCDSSPESGWLPALATPMAAPSAGSAAQAALSITDPARMGSRELTHGSPWLATRADFPLLSRVSRACSQECGLRTAECGLRRRSQRSKIQDYGLRTAECGLRGRSQRVENPGMRATDCGLRAA